MQTGNADRSGKLENNRYKETGNLISICMPPIMGNTIAAVFLCLSAISVKGFLAWLLLSALLLQLPEPASDALPFGRSWRSALLFHLTLPLGKVTVILFHNGFRFPIGRHECLHIGIIILTIFKNAKNGRKKTGNLFVISCLNVPFYVTVVIQFWGMAVHQSET